MLKLCFSEYHFFAVTIVCCAQQGAGKEKSLTELQQLVQHSNADTNRVNYLLAISNHYFSNRPLATTDSPLLCANEAATLSAQLPYPKGLGSSYISLSTIWRNKRDTLRGKEYVNKAIVVFEKAHLYTDLGYAQFELSGYYALLGDELTERIKIVEAAMTAFRKDRNVKKESDGLKE